jgi:hypothetical protein
MFGALAVGGAELLVDDADQALVDAVAVGGEDGLEVAAGLGTLWNTRRPSAVRIWSTR